MSVATERSFGERLKQLREELGVTQYALAKKSGVTAQAISKIEQGDRDPGWSTVVKLAHGLGVSVAEFDESVDAAEPAEPNDEPPPPPPAKKPAPKKPKR
ncbi:helix-turn-helix domain-containing protein [Gemmata sp.]|uniref:helix-turn-helix domain-containing protein n=1 Tax=Gemmata sp. TaxID=1914242 RepID=UPI003F72023D